MRTDLHIHVDRIGGPHKTQPPEPREVFRYARREGIDLLGLIYEDEETLRQYETGEFSLLPFYWVRSPLHPRIPASAGGVKLHPYIERYPLSLETVGPTLEVARDRSLPVLVHTDDRIPDLSRGRLFAQLAEEFPELSLIMAHSGSYAPADIDNPSRLLGDEALTLALVTEAVEVAQSYANLYLETSILAHPGKARILAEKAPADRLLLGSDFPIGKGVFGSVVFQENALMAAGLSWEAVRQAHENARRLWRQAG